jgi:hypothetical protein
VWDLESGKELALLTADGVAVDFSLFVDQITFAHDMELVPKAEFSILTRANKAWIPELIAVAGPEVTESYIDFFTATIRNRNTRQAYARALLAVF